MQQIDDPVLLMNTCTDHVHTYFDVTCDVMHVCMCRFESSTDTFISREGEDTKERNEREKHEVSYIYIYMYCH